MEELLIQVQKLATKFGFYMFFVKLPSTGSPSKNRSQIKVAFEKYLDAFGDSSPQLSDEEKISSW